MSILEKISESEPCGVDFKYDDEYIAIETEIEKNFNVSNTGETQWDIVILKCENVLINHSKDLKILSYWLYAQWKINAQSLFFTTFETYIGVLERYNKDLFPKANKRKIKIFEWTEKVLEDSLLKLLDDLNKINLDKFYELLELLEKTLPALIESEYDLFKDVRIKCAKQIEVIKTKEEEELKQEELQKQEQLKKQEQLIAQNEAEEQRREEESEILSKFSSQNTQESSAQFNALGETEIDDITSTILSLSKELLEKSPGDFIGYKILFNLAEILLEEASKNNSTITDNFLPSNDIIQATRRLGEGSVSFPQLKALIEQLILRPTWIEGYYTASKILYKLSQTDNATQLENMLFHFLSQNNEIVKMTIGDQEMVPENLVLWMQTKLLSLNDSDNSAIEYQHAYQEVMKIKKEENAQNAFMVLEKHYQKAQNEESRFRWRLLMVDFALEIGDKKLALSLLYELERVIAKYQIDLWQPALAISVYEMLLKPLFAQELSSENKERIYSKLSILDVQKVIKL